MERTANITGDLCFSSMWAHLSGTPTHIMHTDNDPQYPHFLSLRVQPRGLSLYHIKQGRYITVAAATTSASTSIDANMPLDTTTCSGSSAGVSTSLDPAVATVPSSSGSSILTSMSGCPLHRSYRLAPKWGVYPSPCSSGQHRVT